jgi:Xaa-Pro aminopeptidase
MRSDRKALFAALAILVFAMVASDVDARRREPNGAYSSRRAKLRTQVDGPVVIFGYTGREDASPSYIFSQEENFYYLTGHNEEGAALLLLPDNSAGSAIEGPREILFLPPRNPRNERWNGPRLAPGDANIEAMTSFAAVEPFANLKDHIAKLSKEFTNIYTLLPRGSEAGYPHRANWLKWLQENANGSGANFRDVSQLIAAMRQVKSATEMELLTFAIERSMDAHLEAWKIIRPGAYEYEVAARMRETYQRAGCERDGYAPIVGSGFFSTVLHYNKNDKRIEDGDLVLMDVAGECAGYTSDITRTVPASGKFTARQREIYDIVLAAQNAAIAAIKPGMTLGGTDEKSLQKIALDVINSRGKDKNGEPLGKYFIHGLGHQIGLNVHDVGVPGRALEAGMVITIEPGIYIPEENLGVRIEDNILVTETGYKLLTARLPRTAAEIEKYMADSRKKSARD